MLEALPDRQNQELEAYKEVRHRFLRKGFTSSVGRSVESERLILSVLLGDERVFEPRSLRPYVIWAVDWDVLWDVLKGAPPLGPRVAKLEDEMSSAKKWLRILAKQKEWYLEEDIEPTLLESSTLTKKQQLLKSAEESLDELERAFEDLERRLELVMKVKATLRELWVLARRGDDRYAKQVASMAHDALKNARAEELRKEQVAVVRSILETLKSRIMTMEDAKRAHDALTSVGLEYMPVIHA